MLEKESGDPWQLWSLAKQENGTYHLIPKHAPAMALDEALKQAKIAPERFVALKPGQVYEI